MIQEKLSAPEQTLIIKALKFNGLTALGCVAVLIQVYLVYLSQRRGEDNLGGLPIALGLLVYFVIFYGGYRIEITSSEVTVVRFFRLRKTVRISDIKKWMVEEVSLKGLGTLRRIVIETYKESRPFKFLLYSFKKEDIQKLIELMPPQKRTEA